MTSLLYFGIALEEKSKAELYMIEEHQSNDLALKGKKKIEA